jgi:hypothetical protein
MVNKIIEKITIVIALVGLIGGLFFWFSANITGNVIGGTNNSVWLGTVFLLVGLVGMFFWTHLRKKLNLKKSTKKSVKKTTKKRKTKKK